MQRLLLKSLASLLFLSLINPVAAKQTRQPESVPEFRPGYLIGYLKQQDLPNSLSLLPPPPAVATPAFALDQSWLKTARPCVVANAGSWPSAMPT